MDTPSRKQREFIRREEEILAAALHLFQRDDWAAVTIDEIAQEAEVGKGTLYKHFRSKNELYARLSLNFYHRMLGHLQGIEMEGNLIQRLRRSLREVFRFHLDNAEYRNLTQFCERVDIRSIMEADIVAEFDQLDAAFDHYAEAMLAEAVRGGRLPDIPAFQQILGIRATFSGAFSFLWTGNLSRFIDNDTLIDQIINYMIAGLLHQHEYAQSPEGPRP